MDYDTEELIQKEGWELVVRDGQEKIKAFGKLYPKVHPVSIYLKRYRKERNPELKYQYMKKVHDYFWPHHADTWHYWTERRFRAHCKGYNFISHAGGASTAKSFDLAKIGLIFFFANPHKRRVVVASTTLDSAEARVWGYIIDLLGQMDVILPFKYSASKPPRILNPVDPITKLKNTRHGIFAVSAKRGDSKTTISTWIGVHPDDSLMLILDEGTDMPLAISESMANLDPGKKPFQCNIIGNSDSIFDLHGSFSTPLDGWGSVDPLTMTEWVTTQKNGICLFYSCYESPAIHETDPVRQRKLSQFLIDQEGLNQKIRQYGKDSDAFWRFVLGFWRTVSTDETVISEQFIKDFDIFLPTEWSGLYNMDVVGGLDPAFSTGGDSCILRLAVLGVDSNGRVVLDFQGNDLLYPIQLSSKSQKSFELQITDQVVEILRMNRCPVSNICIDANGQGRALGGLLQTKANELKPPFKIYSTRQGGDRVNSFDVIIKSSYELWYTLRKFIENKQIRGLDQAAMQQLVSRLEVKSDKAGGKVRKLETKADYKTRMKAVDPRLAHSPDEADAATLAVQSAILNFGFTAGQFRNVNPELDPTQEKFNLHQLQMKDDMQNTAAEKRNLNLKADFSTSLAEAIMFKHPLSRD